MAVQPNAVYFAKDDYAHIARRFVAFALDFVFVVVIWSVLTFALLANAGGTGTRQDIAAGPDSDLGKQDAAEETTLNLKSRQRLPKFTLLLVCLVYQIGMRRLPGGTLGYRLAGIRLVDESGGPPSWRALIKRSCIAIALAMFLCVPLLISYLYALKHPKRQTGHDFWSGTWAVRKRAKPAGPALTTYQSKLLLIFLLNYIDVEPYTPGRPSPEPEPALASEDAHPSEA